jgi:Ni2+-binding GTPase involved in maturation of urease and hydrogenase
MTIHLVSGFLGSGKTTAITFACRALLRQGVRVGVITNDQGDRIVDGEFFRSLDIPGRQVVNGCFCCNYNEMDACIGSLEDASQPDVIFAEAVGSCTDVVATVMKPLLEYRKNIAVTVSVLTDARLLYMQLRGNTLLFEESINYIYFKQLEEAGIIVVNKIDLMSEADLEAVKRAMEKRYSDKVVLYQNSLTAGHAWMKALDAGAGKLSSLEIDYDIYGAGEALLAWLDQELEVVSPDNRAAEAAVDLTEKIYGKIREGGWSIGHLKYLLDGRIKISYTAIAENAAPELDAAPAASTAKLLINARVQTEPAILSRLVSDAIEETEEEYACTISVIKAASFQPGRPKPTYRRT